jgi:phenylalanyl-tRNA synthetase alpha chain
MTMMMMLQTTRLVPRVLSRPLRLNGSLRKFSLGKEITELEGYPLNAPDCNATSNIASRVGANLHQRPLHPLHTIQQKIRSYWGDSFRVFDDLSPVVSTRNCFDLLRIQPDHVSRSVSDTYYLNKETVLRTHTSAHQVDLLKSGLDKFLVTGDVYRRDEIDRSHYPVFHQTEGVKMFSAQELEGKSPAERIAYMENDLKQELEGLAAALFGPTEYRWVDGNFPFTDPSYELEIYWQGEWLEVLGCGVIHPEILHNAGRGEEQGWAFGLGLERLAMVLFDIPDIRLFWTDDERFHSQFQSGKIIKFNPYSKYPPCFKDVSFWLGDKFHANDLNEIVRDVAGDLAEQVVGVIVQVSVNNISDGSSRMPFIFFTFLQELIDDFTHPKTGKTSHCYRIAYRSMDRSLTNAEIDALQERVRDLTVDRLGVELR